MNAVDHISIFQGFIAWLISCLSSVHSIVCHKQNALRLA